MNKKIICLIAFCLLFMAVSAQADDVYDPPFQISGVVKDITPESIEVYLPYINKQVTVLITPETLIVDRIDEKSTPRELSALKIEDLVIVKGVLKQESFCSKNISFLSVSKR